MNMKLLSDGLVEPERSARRTRWMVVDDDDGVRDFVTRVLEMRGEAEVAPFRCPQEALTAFSATPDQFQFVITDLDMPGMDGIELCRQLRALSPGLKVVLATGNSAPDEASARQCGFFGLLAKPFPATAVWGLLEAAGVTTRPAQTAAQN